MKKILLLLISIPFLLYGQGGKSGAKFLLTQNSRLSSLGESYAAISFNGASILGNPAGLIKNDKINIEMGIREYIQDISSQFLLFKTNISKEVAIGFHLLNTRIPEIEIRTQPGEPEGSFTSQHLSTGLSIGYGFENNIKFGLTAKFLYEKYFVDENSGIGLDFGAMYIPIDNLNLGFSLRNLGKMSNLVNISTTLPTIASLGGSYIFNLPQISSVLLIASDVHDNIYENIIHVSNGVEFTYDDILSLRFGHITGYETKGISFGLGLSYWSINLDYSYTPFSLSLGNSHILTIGFEL